MLAELPFYIFGILTVLGATGVLFFRNLMYAAYSLIFALSALAGLYIFSGAEFVGVTQLLVYVGGIVVLLIFGIMLSQAKKDEEKSTRKGIAVLLFFGFLFLYISFIYKITWPAPVPAMAASNNVKDLGISFFTEHLLAFEIAAILLLVAMIGAMVISRKY
ncbi:MAG: NADH-quinone oxidoreductase subunit J family protein [Candidatus Cyclobacteriaceae bacterium M2_1C_046]